MTATARVEVASDIAAAPLLKPDVPGEVINDGLTATVALAGIKAGDEGVVCFKIANTACKPVLNMQPYMGAMGLLVVVSADGKEYVDAHPIDEKTAGNVVVFAAHFPATGLYKGWGQGKVAVVPFVLCVE